MFLELGMHESTCSAASRAMEKPMFFDASGSAEQPASSADSGASDIAVRPSSQKTQANIDPAGDTSGSEARIASDVKEDQRCSLKRRKQTGGLNHYVPTHASSGSEQSWDPIEARTLGERKSGRRPCGTNGGRFSLGL